VSRYAIYITPRALREIKNLPGHNRMKWLMSWRSVNVRRMITVIYKRCLPNYESYENSW